MALNLYMALAMFPNNAPLLEALYLPWLAMAHCWPPYKALLDPAPDTSLGRDTPVAIGTRDSSKGGPMEIH